MREHTLRRTSAETDVQLSLRLDAPEPVDVRTGCGFFDHMLTLFARHGRFGLTAVCAGDLAVDAHHTVEDVGIALGTALRAALGECRGIARYGHAVIPMDEALVETVVDVSGRAYLACGIRCPSPRVGAFDTELGEEFLQAFVRAAGVTLHVRQLAGRNSHHILEAAFKGPRPRAAPGGRAGRGLCRRDPLDQGGALSMGGLAVVEYGVGNLFSLGASLRHIGCAAAVTADARALDAADGIILPGVGAFGDAADRLRAAGLFEPLRALGRAASPSSASASGCSCCLTAAASLARTRASGSSRARWSRCAATCRRRARCPPSLERAAPAPPGGPAAGRLPGGGSACTSSLLLCQTLRGEPRGHGGVRRRRGAGARAQRQRRRRAVPPGEERRGGPCHAARVRRLVRRA